MRRWLPPERNRSLAAGSPVDGHPQVGLWFFTHANSHRKRTYKNTKKMDSRENAQKPQEERQLAAGGTWNHGMTLNTRKELGKPWKGGDRGCLSRVGSGMLVGEL